jgi:hypothetical protein
MVKIFKKYSVPLPLQGQAVKVITDMQTGMMGASKEALAMSKQAHDYLDDQIESVKSAPPDSQQKAYQAALANVRTYYSQFPNGPAKAGGLQELASAPPLYDQQWIDQKQLAQNSGVIARRFFEASAGGVRRKARAPGQAESNLFLAKTQGAQAEHHAAAGSGAVARTTKLEEISSMGQPAETSRSQSIANRNRAWQRLELECNARPDRGVAPHLVAQRGGGGKGGK